ncbi:GLPGLI family protein [Polaribacter sp. M15]
MKNIIFSIFFLFYFGLLTSQNKKQYFKVKASYGVKTKVDKTKKSYKFLLERMPEVAMKKESISSEFDFTLVFNDTTSVFYLEEKLFSDNSIAAFALLDAKYYGRIIQNSENYITEELNEAFGKFLVSRAYQEWKLHEETKQIGDYLCFKATSFSTVTNPKGKIFRKDFTAWYAPELPYKFGPIGYGNLPGLIIELQGESFTYGVKKIEFIEGEDKKNLMPKLKKKKLITEVEFEKLAAEDEKRWRKRNN